MRARPPKRQIDVKRQVDEVADQMVAAVVEQNVPPVLFWHSGQVWERTGLSGGRPGRQLLDSTRFLDVLARSADYVEEMTWGTGVWVPADIPTTARKLAHHRLFLAQGDLPAVSDQEFLDLRR